MLLHLSWSSSLGSVAIFTSKFHMLIFTNTFIILSEDCDDGQCQSLYIVLYVKVENCSVSADWHCVKTLTPKRPDSCS